MKPVRCAIYTRKSSDEGLEQGFNSLDAQREACAAYILSQASEGWTALPEVYDDGGISGGTLARPALQRLLADVAAGRIDNIVVYKVDRLTRSLLDFSKLVEAFDTANVSFVSITQSFNTTTSMGRLTLNMLLSFAQFEREVTAERIRDKIAASKAKGMWMGGIPPLGYAPDGRSLKIVPPHAAIVRDIFERYLALGNVRRVAEQLAREDVLSPVRIKAKTGQSFGGVPLTRGQIYSILKNPAYVGEVHHREQVYPGLHEAIVDRGVWERTKAMLAGNLQGHRSGARAAQSSLLAGKVVDQCGAALIATHACKGSRRYRYYSSATAENGRSVRIPAGELEAAVVEKIAEVFAQPLELTDRWRLAIATKDLERFMTLTEATAIAVRQRDRAVVNTLITKVRILASAVEFDLDPAGCASLLGIAVDAIAPPFPTLVVDARLSRSGRAVRFVRHNGVAVRAVVDHSLIKQIIRARYWWLELREGQIDISRLAAREKLQPSYVTRILRFAFLSPETLTAIISGQHKTTLSIASLSAPGGIPVNWFQQRQSFFAADPI